MDNFVTRLASSAVTFVLLCCVVTPAAPETVVKSFSHDICSEGLNLFKSQDFAKTCNSLELPTSNISIYNDEERHAVLCLSVVDLASQLCLYNSERFYLSEENIPPVQCNSTVFCSNMAQKYEPVMSDVSNYTDQLQNVLKNPEACHRLCTSLNGEFAPICKLILLIVSLKDKYTNTNSGLGIQSSRNQETTQTGLEKNDALDRNPVSHKKDEKAKVTPAIDEKNAASLMKPATDANNAKYVENDPPHTENIVNKNSQQPKNTVNDARNNSENAVKSAGPSQHNNASSSVTVKAEIIETTISTIGEKTKQGESVSKIDTGKTEHTISQDTQVKDELQNIEDENDEKDLDGSEDTVELPLEDENNNQDSLAAPESKGKLPRYHNMPDEDDSHFFTYFTIISLACIAGYLGYHNKQKILAILVEGRRSRGGRGRRRPSTANYRKLDCTLEEAVTSQCNSNVTHVIY